MTVSLSLYVTTRIVESVVCALKLASYTLGDYVRLYKCALSKAVCTLKYRHYFKVVALEPLYDCVYTKNYVRFTLGRFTPNI